MTSKTPEEKKIPPVKNNAVPSSGNDRVYLVTMLGVLFGGVLCLLYAGYMHGHMSISAVLKNL